MQKLQRFTYVLFFISLAVCVLYFAREFLIPLALSGVLATLFIGFCTKLENRGMDRGMSSLCAILLFLGAVAIIVFLLTWKLNDLTENIEGMEEQIVGLFDSMKSWINEKIGVSAQKQDEMIKQTESANGENGNMLFNFASGTVNVLIKTILVIVYMYLFLYFRSRIKKFILMMVPKSQDKKAERVIEKSAKVSQQYLSGLSKMILLLWIMYGIGFSIVGVENAIFFAVLCGILEIVPFIGNITGTSITVLAVVAQGGGSNQIIGVVAIYLFVQFIQTYLIEPLVVGDEVNINPLFTIIILVAGELIWGIPGMILAIPLLGIVKIICDSVPQLQPYGYLIGSDRKRKTSLIDKVKNLFVKK